MDKKKVFEILDILETKDNDSIKAAYRTKLTEVNPEDDPEGFKALREAYEEAVRLINVQDEEALPDTPVNRWIQRAESIYNNLWTRIDISCWQALFEEEICKDFDTENEIKEIFLRFLMDYYRLPSEVWALIEDTFELTASRNELYEKFPADFVDFITETPESKSWIDYTQFKGDETADVDEFIHLYLSLRRMNDNNQYEDIDEVLTQLARIDLWHPYLEVEKMRYCLASKKNEEAAKILNTLRAENYKDIYIKYYIAETDFELGSFEEAFETCHSLLETNPNHFGAKMILCSYYLQKKEYKKAKDGYIELLEIDHSNDTLVEGLKKANESLITEYEEQLKQEPDNKALKLDLGWCFFQNNLFSECIALIEDIEPDKENYYDYYNLISRTYITMENYEKAYPFVKVWLGEILKAQGDDSEKAKTKLRRLAFAYYAMAMCFYHFGTQQDHSKDRKEADLDKYIKYIDLAIEAEGNGRDLVRYLSAKAHDVLKLEKYELCMDVCDRIVSIDKGFFPAYVYRQEAAYNLRMAQEVIDDYYSAIEIYPKYAKPYVFAAKVFIIYDQYEDAMGVVKRAKEAEVESSEMIFQELRIKRMTTESTEEEKAVVEELKKFYSDMQKEQGDLEDLSLVLYELAVCYYDMKKYRQALDALEQKLQLKKSDGCFTLKGDILYNMEKYNEAISAYKNIEYYPAYVEGYFKTGNCYVELGNEEKAISFYLKVIENYSDHKYVNNELMEIYHRRYKNSYNQEDYDRAVSYGKRQIEIYPDCYYWNGLGLVYLDGYDLENALKVFEEAIKCDETDMYPYNNIGFVYKIKGEFDKAYHYYQLSIERRTNEDMLPYWNLATCYDITEQYEKAVETYEFIISKLRNPKKALEELACIYEQQGQWQKAIEQYQRIRALSEDNEMDYLTSVGFAYCCSGNYTEAHKYYKQALKKFSKKKEPYTYMGNFMFWISKDYKKALKYYEKAYKVAKKYDSDYNDYLDDMIYDLLFVLRKLGKTKQSIQYFDEIHSYIQKEYGSVETWLSNPGRRKIRLYYVAVWNFCIGQYERAKHFMRLMKDAQNCRNCDCRGCYEYFRLEGMLQELEGQNAKTLECYEKAFNICPNSLHHLSKIKELK